MTMIRKEAALAELEKLAARVAPDDVDGGFAIEACIHAIGMMEAESKPENSQEQDVVDELLRSGTPSDMRILGVINDLRGQLQYWRKIAKAERDAQNRYQREIYIFPEHWTLDGVDAARKQLAADMVEDLIGRGYALSQMQEPKDGKNGRVTLTMSVGRRIEPDARLLVDLLRENGVDTGFST